MITPPFCMRARPCFRAGVPRVAAALPLPFGAVGVVISQPIVPRSLIRLPVLMSALDGNVLVLNSDFRPLNVCNVRRAVVLLEKDKAQTVELDGVLLRSERRSLRAPSVIRLAYHVKRPRPVVKLTRREILARDDHQCQYCGKRGN